MSAKRLCCGFADLIEQRLGLQFASSALKELSVVLRQRMRMLRCSGSDAYQAYRIGACTSTVNSRCPTCVSASCSKRDGDLPSARREFENASILLAREHAARILLFGGGLSRTTLINLSASELRRCEESN